MVHDGLDAEGSGHMKDYICIFGQLFDEFLVANIAFDEGDLVEDVSDVLLRARGKVVEDCDAVATRN